MGYGLCGGAVRYATQNRRLFGTFACINKTDKNTENKDNQRSAVAFSKDQQLYGRETDRHNGHVGNLAFSWCVVTMARGLMSLAQVVCLYTHRVLNGAMRHTHAATQMPRKHAIVSDFRAYGALRTQRLVVYILYVLHAYVRVRAMRSSWRYNYASCVGSLRVHPDISDNPVCGCEHGDAARAPLYIADRATRATDPGNAQAPVYCRRPGQNTRSARDGGRAVRDRHHD